MEHILAPFYYFTDDKRGLDPRRIADQLPKGCGIILRHYNTPDRANMAEQLSEICKERRLRLSISNDPALSARLKVPGCHLPEYRIPQVPRLKSRYPGLTFTVACHSRRSLHLAARVGADAAFLSPLFPTRSHPGARTLGPVRAGLLLRDIPIPVYALGGITPKSWQQLSLLPFAGFGAIDGFEKGEFRSLGTVRADIPVSPYDRDGHRRSW
ncbi:thiamine phosphate synthase [Sneathiella chinensis]|uniref:thiamine phosphate synthase n=1 Tax=Sneathiella chinensis TaxID=349750 RepID=UPI00146C4E6A